MREHVSTKFRKRIKHPRDSDESCLPLWWQKSWLYSCCFHSFSLVKEFLQYLWWCCFSLSPISISTIPAPFFLPTSLHPVHWKFPPVPVICVEKQVPCAVRDAALDTSPGAGIPEQPLANFSSRARLFHLADYRIFSNNPEKERCGANKQNIYRGANDGTCVQLRQFLNSSCMAEHPSHFLTVTFSMPFLIIPLRMQIIRNNK